LAGIGSLPATLRDRSILIALVAAPEGQLLARFDPFDIKIETILARKLARWAKDNYAALVACDPALPPGVFNHLTSTGVKTLSTTSPTKTNGHDLDRSLFEDVRQIFTQSGVTRLSSKQLVDSLLALPSRPWHSSLCIRPAAGGTTEDGRKAKSALDWLARRLRPFGVNPFTLRIGGHLAKGYDLTDFAQPFSHFLNDAPS